MKKAVVSVTNDLVTDQRVLRTISVLQELNFRVTFVGRQLPNSLPFTKEIDHRRFKLLFTKGFFFYASYNLRLFFFLLFRKYDLYLSNDLDTLLPNYLISSLKRKPLVYDSHEYFTGVPEIQNRPLVKRVWTSLERWIFPKLKDVVTVNESIADLYHREYGKEIQVVRNISDSSLPKHLKSRKELGLPEDRFLLINQGAGINVDRGMEEMLETLQLLPQDISLVLVGKGDVLPKLKEQIRGGDLENRVIFIDPRPYLEMLQYTLNADCGISLDKDTNLNYRFSLPNKVFDYIKSGIPLVVSGLVEVRKVVEKYKIGEVIKDHSPQSIAEAILAVKADKARYRENLKQAAAENNWEKERQVWFSIFTKYS